MSKEASLNKAVVVLWHTTALVRDPYCVSIRVERKFISSLGVLPTLQRRYQQFRSVADGSSWIDRPSYSGSLAITVETISSTAITVETISSTAVSVSYTHLTLPTIYSV